MKNPVLFTILITLITASIGVALWASGYPPERKEISGWKVTAYALITWPFFFAIAGLIFSVPVLYIKRNQVGVWESKAGRAVLIGVLANPVIMLIMQILFPLEAMDIISNYTGDLTFLIIYTVIIVLMANYVSVQKPGSPSGLRNRWTLASDRVWTKTHRFLGRSLVVSILIVNPIAAVINVEYALEAMVATMMIMLTVSILYSWHLSSRANENNVAR